MYHAHILQSTTLLHLTTYLFMFLLRFMIAAVSPAVVIPSLILLQEKGLGRDKGVPSLVMAASGIDDVLAIGLLLYNPY